MLYAPHAIQQKIHDDKSRYKVLNWGRRTGKSTLAVNYTVWEALKKYETKVKNKELISGTFNYFIVAPTYRQAKTIFWNDIVKTQIPRGIITKFNEADLELYIPHHTTDFGAPNLTDNAKELPAITIALKGAENEDSLRGVRLSGAVLDECAFMPDFTEIWERIIRPALADEKGWAIFISTPNGFNNFYELSEHAQATKNWSYCHATIYDNPHIDREEIEQIKDEEMAKDPDGNTWHQEYMADFRQRSGLVFSQFDRKKHLIAPDQIPLDGTNLIGIDFGYENPFAAVFVRVDYDQNWFVYDLIYRQHMTTDECIANLRLKMSGQSFAAIIGDSASRQEIENFKSRNFPIKGVGKGKDSVLGGIRLIADKLKVQEGTGKPKLFINEDLKPMIQEFEMYVYADPKEGFNMRETPQDSNNHAIDALRYLMLSNASHRRPMVKIEKRFDKITGRRLI